MQQFDASHFDRLLCAPPAAASIFHNRSHSTLADEGVAESSLHSTAGAVGSATATAEKSRHARTQSSPAALLRFSASSSALCSMSHTGMDEADAPAAVPLSPALQVRALFLAHQPSGVSAASPPAA